MGRLVVACRCSSWPFLVVVVPTLRRGMGCSVQSRSLPGIMDRFLIGGGWSVVRVSAWDTELGYGARC